MAKPLPPVLNVVWDCAQIVWVPDYAQKLNIDDGEGGNLANLVDFWWKLEFVPNILSKIVVLALCFNGGYYGMKTLALIDAFFLNYLQYLFG